jgi:hypothetical protein
LPGSDGLGIHVALDLAGNLRFGPDVTWVDAVSYAFDESRAEAFYRAIRRYYPGLADGALAPGFVGVRPKLGPAGSGFVDFVLQGREIHGVPGLLNLFGIDSPGLTSCLAIADEVARCAWNNDKGPKIVIDGGSKVMLSGGGTTRILYMNTCDQNQVWTTSHCDNQDSPQLTVQNLTFANANSKSEPAATAGGGAIYASGGRLKVINSRFMNNVCADTGPDVGGAGIRAFQQYNNLPIYVVNSTFGGSDGAGNTCSNGGGISSIGVS